MAINKTIGWGLFTMVMSCCIEPFSVPTTEADVHFLVVDGVYKNQDGAVQVRLSRTTPLSAGDSIALEPLADVRIESQEGQTTQLFESTEGFYSRPSVTLESGKQYRLLIKTSDNKEYASEFVPYKETPVIDSVFWRVEDNDVHIYVNSHDDSNGSRYYLWNFSETWFYHASFQSNWKFKDGMFIKRMPEEMVFNCWKTLISTQILLGTTRNLTNDIVSFHEVEKIPLISGKFQFRWSIYLTQTVLTPEGFAYWEELKKNTEQLGTIFSPLPSQLRGNLHNVNNPEETVVGFVSFNSQQTQRIFITNDQLPKTRHMTGYEGCHQDTLFNDQIQYFRGSSMLIEKMDLGWLTATSRCADCTVQGGVTEEPSFW